MQASSIPHPPTDCVTLATLLICRTNLSVDLSHPRAACICSGTYLCWPAPSRWGRLHSHLTRWQVRPRAGRAAVLVESPTLPMWAPESRPTPPGAAAWRRGAGNARARTGCSGSHALPSSAHAFALLAVSWCAASVEFFGLGRSQDAKKRTATPRVFPLCTPPARLTVVLFTLLLLLHVGGVGARGGRRRHGGGDEPPPPPTTPSADPALPLPAAASAYADVADPSPIPVANLDLLNSPALIPKCWRLLPPLRFRPHEGAWRRWLRATTLFKNCRIQTPLHYLICLGHRLCARKLG